jgi:hypothetical protein
LPHDNYKYDGGDSSKDGSILEGNGELIFATDGEDSSKDGSILEGNRELIFATASVDQDLQCTQAYMVYDEIDPDDENVVDPQSELPILFSMHAAHQLAPIWCAKSYVSGNIV